MFPIRESGQRRVCSSVVDTLNCEGRKMMDGFHKIWIEQCEAAQGIEDEFGTQKALEYLVGEKFLNFLEAAESDTEFPGRDTGVRCPN